MNIAQKYNRSPFDYEPGSDVVYVRLSELFEDNGPDAVYTVRGLFINRKGLFGEQGVIASDNFRVSLPMHMTETVKAMLEDADAIDAINDGRLGFRVTHYRNQRGVFYTIRWVDI